MKNNYELIKFEDGDFSLDVNVSPKEDTVWLTQDQIAELYSRARNTITEHINKIFKENELDPNVVCRKNRQTAVDGKTYVIKLYNLDMILSVGYRIKSTRGNLFRRWANSILKQYLMKGQVINENRCLAHSDNLVQMNNTIININDRLTNLEYEFKSITTVTMLKDKLFYDGQLYEGYSFVKNLFKKAINRIFIIDGYLDYSVLEMMNDIDIDITICIASHTPLSNREISLFQTNHKLNVIRTNNFHDRFIIVDDELYNIGSSIKDIGKKISHISKLESITVEELLQKL